MLLLAVLIHAASSLADPASDMIKCLDDGKDVSTCSAETFENFRPTMKTGVPELDLPPLDPMTIDQILFKFWNVTAAFANTQLNGFQKFEMKYSNIDRKERTWKVGLSLPVMKTTGTYVLYGSIPGFDLTRSSGEERLNAKNVDLTIEMKLGTRAQDKIFVTDFDLKLDLDDIDLELECLFPKENGECCPRKYLKSCNQTLAKVVLRFINKDGKKFIEEFQPQIAKKAGDILKDYLNK